MKDNVFEIPKSKESGIYMIYNVELNKVYIGQTNNFYQRASSHLSQLLSGTHSNNELQNDFNNGYRFAFAILEVVEKDKQLFVAFIAQASCCITCHLLDKRIKTNSCKTVCKSFI